METLYLWYPASPESQKVPDHVFYKSFPSPLQLLAAVSFCRAKSYLSPETKTVPSEFLHCTRAHTYIITIIITLLLLLNVTITIIIVVMITIMIMDLLIIVIIIIIIIYSLYSTRLCRRIFYTGSQK